MRLCAPTGTTKEIIMELNFNEITLLQNAEVLKQKIQEVMTVLQEKGFEANIKPHGVWDMLYMDNTLRFNLYVSIPVHDEEKNIRQSRSTPKRKKAKTFFQAFEDETQRN
jgi:hypothetical protein